MEKIPVRQWQEKFRAGEFEDKRFETQCKAGWYDWFCGDEALAGRLKKIAKVVMGITEPFILDNYYVWFKNNCPMSGPLYDDVRFEPLAGERGGKYFLVALDSPHEKKKWALTTERYGFDAPEFECADVREMVKYIHKMAHELEQGIKPSFIAEKRAVVRFLYRHEKNVDMAVRREGGHCYSYRSAKDRRIKTVVVSSGLENIPPGFEAGRAEQFDGLYVCSQEGAEQPSRIPQKQKKGPER